MRPPNAGVALDPRCPQPLLGSVRAPNRGGSGLRQPANPATTMTIDRPAPCGAYQTGGMSIRRLLAHQRNAIAAVLAVRELQQQGRVTDVGLARLRQRTPTGKVFAPQTWQPRNHLRSPRLQVPQQFVWNRWVADFACDPGAVEGDGSLAAVALDRKWVPKPRGAIDFDRIGGHAPATRAPQLNAARSRQFGSES